MSEMETVNTEKKPDFNETDRAALVEAERAKLVRPTAISSVETPTVEDLHGRLQAIEALLTHVIETYHPDMLRKMEHVLGEWQTRAEGPSEIVDKSAHAR